MEIKITLLYYIILSRKVHGKRLKRKKGFVYKPHALIIKLYACVGVTRHSKLHLELIQVQTSIGKNDDNSKVTLHLREIQKFIPVFGRSKQQRFT